jgi:DNA-binding XRE family transcriptional regulator
MIVETYMRPAGKLRKSWRSAARSSPHLRGTLSRLGGRLRALRLERDLTQEQIAEGARLDAKHYQAIESGRTNVTMASLVGISRSLGVKLAEIFHGM